MKAKKPQTTPDLQAIPKVSARSPQAVRMAPPGMQPMHGAPLIRCPARPSRSRARGRIIGSDMSGTRHGTTEGLDSPLLRRMRGDAADIGEKTRDQRGLSTAWGYGLGIRIVSFSWRGAPGGSWPEDSPDSTSVKQADRRSRLHCANLDLQAEGPQVRRESVTC